MMLVVPCSNYLAPLSISLHLSVHWALFGVKPVICLPWSLIHFPMISFKKQMVDVQSASMITLVLLLALVMHTVNVLKFRTLKCLTKWLMKTA